MDRDAAALMGIRVNRVYAITFGIGALMAGACGALLAVVFPITTSLTGQFLGKAFVVCVIGGLGTVPGALVGGLALGLIESVAGHVLGPQHAVTDRLPPDVRAADDQADRACSARKGYE